MQNNKINKTYAVALGGVIAALSAALMLFSAVFPLAEFVLPASAGILLIAAVYEVGEGWALLIYAAVGLLSFLLPSNKDSAVYYILFLGFYPVLKSYLERIKNIILKWAVKLIIFNASSAASVFVLVKLLGITDDMFKYGYLFAALLLNLTFVVYDLAVSRLIVLYNFRLRKFIRRR